VKTLIIDAGHGGSDKGCNFYGYEEKDLNLIVAKRLQVLLKDYSPDITRSTDRTLTNDERVGMIKDQYEYCLSIHFNANAGDRIEGIHSIFSAKGKLLAENITSCLKGIFDLPVRVFSRSHEYSTGKGDYYFMHRRTGSTCTVIVECLPLDTQYRNLYMEQIAVAVANGFKAYMGNQKQEDMQSSDTVHYVEVDPLRLESVKVSDYAKNLPCPNFTSGMFSLKDHLIHLLVVDGEKIYKPRLWDYGQKGTMVIHNSGLVQVNSVRDLANVNGVKLAFQGFNLDYEKNGSRSMEESILKEGWLSDVYRNTNRGGIGYNPEKNKLVLAHIKGTAEDLRKEMRKLGCIMNGNTCGIGLDAGSMDAFKVNGKLITAGENGRVNKLEHIFIF